MPMPPPLPRIAFRDECQQHSIRRRSAAILTEKTVPSYFYRSATVNAHAEDIVGPSYVISIRAEIEPLAVARPGIQGLGSVTKSEAFQLPGCESKNIDVAVACARRRKGKLTAVRRIEGTRFGRWM